MNETGISEGEGTGITGLDETDFDFGVSDPSRGPQDGSDGGVGGGSQDG